ncbi:MAG: NAD(P)H-binding protein [Reichenbachiella sp.]|uniref:NAD(P)H-binding protein n=1 Tax=Reichenbachiella sp. TaxID=2184521 RepID=UPI003267A8BF
MNSISILGCGWLGLPLARNLVKAGYSVSGSTTRISKIPVLEKEGIAPCLVNLNPKLEESAKHFFDTDLLIVNLPPRNKNDQEGFHKAQLEEIINAAKKKVKKVIFVSSTAVYPSDNSEVIESDASHSSLSRSGIPLLEMENLFVEESSLETTVIRFGGLYGPDRHPGRFLAGKKNLAGANNPINMIHLEDCIGVISAIIEKGLWGEVFNACSPNRSTRKSFYESAAKELDMVPPAFSCEESPYKLVNSDKLLSATGYKFIF